MKGPAAPLRIARRRTAPARTFSRPAAVGKFLEADGARLYVRGITYGTFGGADQLPSRSVARADLAAMAVNGANAVRLYTVPPPWLLDLASEHGLRVLAGIPWEQHVTFLDDHRACRAIERSVRTAVAACAGHPAILGWFVGNEIPAPIARWHGRGRVERFIESLYLAAKAEDPAALVSYANYPSTEYLDLPFLDFAAYNVFLEQDATFAAYVARLQTLAGDRPLLISELGLDSRRNGAQRQRRTVTGQIATAFAAGCAGALVFSWTDEWSRGGHEVDDWDFGLLDRAREPKPALEGVRGAFAGVPFGSRVQWPSVSVVLCTYNGAATIRESVEALRALDYADYDVVVIDDGSTDGTGAIAQEAGARVIATANHGLSAARNTGIAASTGELVAFCDDDCRPDPQWLRYLAVALRSGDYDGVGGPNLPPPGPPVADGIGHAPGGPTHVLISDSIAEHLPGCNMAFRRDALERVGGFDPRFRVAGDDVDICWRIQDSGGTLGFSPGALVWHRSRATVGAYARQQVGYGRAEALLEGKWPERYNGRGHLDWAGKIHGSRLQRTIGRRRWRVYHGVGGGGLFQSVYGRTTHSRATFPLAPEWYLLVLALLAASLLSLAEPLGASVSGVPVAVFALAACLAAMAGRAATWARAVRLPPSARRRRRAAVRAIVFVLCLVQPLARLYGRLELGLTPWRRRGPRIVALPRRQRLSIWSGCWAPVETWVDRLDACVREHEGQTTRGGGFDAWDLEVAVGALARARVLIAVEEHGQGRQLVRFRVRPACSRRALALDGLLAAAAAIAAVQGAFAAAALLGVVSGWLAGRIAVQAAASAALPARAARSLEAAP